MLAQKKVLVIGLGGLGCSATLALAKGGITQMTLVDMDVVDETNLHRQPWHRTSDVGRKKVDSAADKLRRAFPDLKLDPIDLQVGPTNALSLFQRHDLVLDATDGPQTKLMLSDAAVLSGVPLVYGGALQLKGMVMVVTRQGPCLRCAFEGQGDGEPAATCAQAGVLGPLVGVVGAMMALKGFGALLGRPSPGELHLLDGETLTPRVVRVPKAPDCDTCSEKALKALTLLDPPGRFYAGGEPNRPAGGGS